MPVHDSEEFWKAVRAVYNELFRGYFVPSRAECEAAVKPFAESVARAFIAKTHYALLEYWSPLNPADSLTVSLAQEMVDQIYD